MKKFKRIKGYSIMKIFVSIKRLYMSPKYKVDESNIGLPKIVTEFQRSNIEEIINNRLNNSCHLEECNEDNNKIDTGGKFFS